MSIREIRNTSGASVEVSKGGTARYRGIEVRGSHAATMSAIELLLNQVSTLPDGAPGSIRVVLPVGTAGFVIGRGGEAIKEIRRASGAEANLDKDVPQGKFFKRKESSTKQIL
eukprot:TRINITY_DN12505_c0_g1_i6.p1 TRINITY_DN12505_c0_g1~~TRINITY_DN12505_c0_g1_i6.p1  ORF type:complete len:113 (+),score=20.27 TRINITY_DN12505_c0_g1_i6:55-393(+)